MTILKLKDINWWSFEEIEAFKGTQGIVDYYHFSDYAKAITSAWILGIIADAYDEETIKNYFHFDELGNALIYLESQRIDNYIEAIENYGQFGNTSAESFALFYLFEEIDSLFRVLYEDKIIDDYPDHEVNKNYSRLGR